MQHDDLIESTAGYPLRTTLPNHPILRGIDLSTIPPLLGFNEVKLRETATSIIDIENLGTWHPLLAEHRFGKGRVSCWTTGASPHWGINFMKWKQYGQFWSQVFAG
jgi:uncharacterized membrane protein